MYDVLSSMGDTENVKVGHLLQIQHVIAKFGVGKNTAEQWLSELEQKGYLEYQDETFINGRKRISGWHITQKGVDLIKER